VKQILVIIILFLTLESHLFAQEKLVLSRGGSVYNILSEKVLHEAYKRIGITIRIEAFPSERSLTMANIGDIDGEILRSTKIQKEYPNLILIKVPVVSLKVVVFSKNHEFPIQGWESLKPYSIAIVRGMKPVENKLKGMTYYKVHHFQQAFQMILNGRVDIAIHTFGDGKFIIKEHKLKGIKVLEPPIMEVKGYHYLHKKHENLVSRITDSLQQMENEKLIQKMQADFEESLSN